MHDLCVCASVQISARGGWRRLRCVMLTLSSPEMVLSSLWHRLAGSWAPRGCLSLPPLPHTHTIHPEFTWVLGIQPQNKCFTQWSISSGPVHVVHSYLYLPCHWFYYQMNQCLGEVNSICLFLNQLGTKETFPGNPHANMVWLVCLETSLYLNADKLNQFHLSPQNTLAFPTQNVSGRM